MVEAYAHGEPLLMVTERAHVLTATTLMEHPWHRVYLRDRLAVGLEKHGIEISLLSEKLASTLCASSAPTL